ncbi:MAG: hypothetical protein AAF958_11390, partial [Planctomycetota bacterium]
GSGQLSTTVLDFSLVQPLLRNGGRDVVLESLTQAERDLLAEVRDFERFRRSFFFNIAVGRPLNSPGGVFGAGGMLGLLQTQLQVRNLEENISRLTETVLIFEDSLVEQLTKIPDNITDILNQQIQIEQSRSSLNNSLNALIQQKANFEAQKDAFLRSLGLPPYICTRIEDPFLDSFNLIDRDILGRRRELAEVRLAAAEANLAILQLAKSGTDPETGLPIKTYALNEPLIKQLGVLYDSLEPVIDFDRALIEKDVVLIREDLDELSKLLPKRRAVNKQMQSMYREERDQICTLLGVSEIDESLFDLTVLDDLEDVLREEVDRVEKRLESFTEDLNDLRNLIDELSLSDPETIDPVEFGEKLTQNVVLASQDLLTDIGDVVLQLQLAQARARTESLTLPSIDLDQSEAFEIAIRNRRDYANAKAELVDAWRAIEVIADDLESTLDFTLTGRIDNDARDLFDLRDETGQLRAGLRWDAPITRLIERNNYRTTQILFEQAKRTFYGVEDTIWQVLRQELRQLQANRLRFELSREALRIATLLIQLTNDRQSANEARGRPPSVVAARDRIEALNGLLSAQNGLLGVYVNYEVLRRSLDLDLGTMELTPEGIWIDPEEVDAGLLLDLPGTDFIPAECSDCQIPYQVDPR